ncbi:hypothetical protein MHH52_07330 [Paenibacillus sp. FSL K6-0276]|uniref:hypothetical protein n=1 Tax=Paenibacillus sp. FSL K6-0276 TaxID=2921450 RepID=UPI0030ED6761
MKTDHKDHKQVTLTTGPVYVPRFNDDNPNDKLIVTLKNPTHKKLQAQVTLGICNSPNPPQVAGGGGTSNSVQTFEIMETETNLGFFKVDPMTCLRIEKTFVNNQQPNNQLQDSVIRLTATGDFKICEDSCEPICGLLEISSVVGTETGVDTVQSAIHAEKTALHQGGYYGSSGVDVTDPQTIVLYANWVFCENHCPCDSDSHSDSSSSSSDDDH